MIEVGAPVAWVSKSWEKWGVVIAAVPAGFSPADAGYPGVGRGQPLRDHDSFVVRARRTWVRKDGERVFLPGTKMYWPRLDGLEGVPRILTAINPEHIVELSSCRGSV